MTTEQIEAPQGERLKSATEAFQNHEERLSGLEALGHALGEAFPHLRDALGLERLPHAFTEDEVSGIRFTPGNDDLNALRADNEQLRKKLDMLIDKLLPPPSSPPPAPDVPSTWPGSD